MRSAGVSGPIAALLSAGIFLSLMNLAVLQWQLGDGGLREMLHSRINRMSSSRSSSSADKSGARAAWGGSRENNNDDYGGDDDDSSAGRDFVASRPRARVLSWSPRVFEIPGLVSREECERLIRKAEARLEFVGTQEDGAKSPSSSAKRRSESMWFNAARDDEDDLVAAVRARLLDSALMPSKYSEPLQVTRYSKGGFYDLHYDFSQPNRQVVSPGLYPHGDVERSATLVLYLSDGFSGGETVFPRIASPGSSGNGLLETIPNIDDEVWKTPSQSLAEFCGDESDALRVKPTIGGGILFFGYLPTGERDMETIHGSCPVRSGIKVIAQQWIQLNLKYATSQTLEDRLLRLSYSSKGFQARLGRLDAPPPLLALADPVGRQHQQEASVGSSQQKSEISQPEARSSQADDSKQGASGDEGDSIVTVVACDLDAVKAAALARSIIASDADAWRGSIDELGSAPRPTSFDLVALVLDEQGVTRRGVGILETAGASTTCFRI